MSLRRAMLAALVILVGAGVASADTKIVQKSHTDGFAIMGQQQPARDEQHVTWVGDQRMRVDQGDNSFIVRLDQKKMYMVDHNEKSYVALDLPFDLSKMVPAEAKQMLDMMKFSVTVTKAGETKKIGDWDTTRYDVKLSSPMMQMNQVIWATKDVDIDLDAYDAMGEQIIGLQPGMAEMAEEMRKVEGVPVVQEGTMTMMGTNVATRQELVSVDKGDPPAGAYEPPTGYSKKEFDFMAMMQNRR